MSASKERERMIQGMQSTPGVWESDRRAVLRGVITGFGEEDIAITTADSNETAGDTDTGICIQFGPLTSFFTAGKELVISLTLNKMQSIAFLIICCHLDLIRQNDRGNISQLYQFVGREGGTGKSQVIEALVELFAKKDLSDRLLITATLGTAAARINSITIHSAYRFTKD